MQIRDKIRRSFGKVWQKNVEAPPGPGRLVVRSSDFSRFHVKLCANGRDAAQSPNPILTSEIDGSNNRQAVFTILAFSFLMGSGEDMTAAPTPR